jgi:hypothetical protein
MKSVNVTRADAVSVPGAYRMDLTIDNANDITPKLFVKQRLVNPDHSTNDVFITVANAVDLEDYAEDAPADGDTYFRTDTASFVSGDTQVLNDIFDEVLQLVQVVCQQASDLETLSTTAVYTVNENGAALDI